MPGQTASVEKNTVMSQARFLRAPCVIVRQECVMPKNIYLTLSLGI